MREARRTRGMCSLVALVVVFALSAHCIAGTIDFRTVPVGSAIGMSAGGNIFFAQSAESPIVYRWIGAGGPVAISLPQGAFGYGVNAISANGRNLVGNTIEAVNGNPVRAFRWTQSVGVQFLDPLAGTSVPQPFATSFDGTTVVGVSGNRAVQWAGGSSVARELPLRSGDTFGYASGVSRDASTIVGLSSNGLTLSDNVAIWRDGSLVRTFPREENGGVLVSPDGSRIVGLNGQFSTMWFTDGSGAIQYASEFVAPRGITPDNVVVYGDIFRLTSGWRGAFWTSRDGVVDINDYLAGAGVDLTNLQLRSIEGISDDRRVIMGTAWNSRAGYQVWIATLPEPIPAPGALPLCLIGSGLMCVRRRRAVCER